MKTFLFFSLSLFVAFSALAQKVEPTFKEVSYGPHEDMTLNFWKIESQNPTPLLVHIHGGGWLAILFELEQRKRQKKKERKTKKFS